jgi:aldehyde:ferredoxin oxidoreductase
VDLTSSKVSKEPLEPALAQSYLGGRGVADYFLFNEVPPGTDPLSAENRLIFMTGPLTGSRIPYTSRMAVVAESPLTLGYTRSMVGGHFPARLKHAGYDGIIVQGKAKSPVYLNIADEKVELLDATELWGRGTGECQEFLKEKHGRASRVALIGPGGENQVLFAGIIVDGMSAAGRGGTGAVMGSKNLKGIVVKGEKGYRAANPAAIEAFARRARQIIRDTPGIQAFSRAGTPEDTEPNHVMGILPTRNYQRGCFEGIKGIVLEELQKYRVGSGGCFACPVACKKRTVVQTGPYQADTFGPEYETVAMLGSNCGNSNIESVIHANMLCNHYSLDTISTGGVIAYAMECYERGLLSREDTDGLELSFGNHAALVELIHKIARREGIGKELALGVRRLSEKRGATSFAAQVKGLEFPAFDPRGLQGFGLAFAVGNRGACHNLTSMFYAEIGRPETDRFATDGKGEILRKWALNYAIYSSATLCSFSRGFMTRELIAEAISDCTGKPVSVGDLLIAAERMYNLERLFNLREGIMGEDDTLPERFLKEPLPDGASQGKVVRLDEMLGDYYKAMDWDGEGVPTQRVLRRLNLQGYS